MQEEGREMGRSLEWSHTSPIFVSVFAICFRCFHSTSVMTSAFAWPLHLEKWLLSRSPFFFFPRAAEKELCALVLVTVCFRVQKTLAAEPKEKGGVQGQRNGLSSLLPLINTRVIPALLRCVYACWCGFTVKIWHYHIKSKGSHVLQN